MAVWRKARTSGVLGIHCAVSVQGVRQGVNQEVRLKARKVRVISLCP
jgi:hypothetical protein